MKDSEPQASINLNSMRPFLKETISMKKL